jgi:O-succinylbenzoic acid--CoA ligase
MLDQDFWISDANHIAVNPYRPEDALGLEEFAIEQGMSGMCFFQTSGSEGHPKWVALSKGAFLISAQAVNAHFEVTPADHWLIALPLHHVGGFAILARAYVSGSNVVQDASRWEPHAFLEMCSRHDITIVSLVPTQMHDVVRNRLHAPNNLRAAIIGGAGMSPELAEAARALGWPVFQSYGMTEAASQIATQAYPSVGSMSEERALVVLPHWQVRADSAGRLLLRGAALAKGYALSAAEGTWSWQPVGEELVTRDLVSLSTCVSRQHLRFMGRESGVVKILGELIHLAPLQARLDSLAMADGLVLPPIIMAMPDLRREIRLILVAESAAGAGLLELFNAVTEPLCQLSEVVHLPHIPRSPLGKVDVSVLQTYLADMGYPIAK